MNIHFFYSFLYLIPTNDGFGAADLLLFFKFWNKMLETGRIM